MPFGAVIVVIITVAGGDIAGTDAKYTLGFIAALFVLSMFIYGDKYAPGFIVDETGIVNYTQEKHAKAARLSRALAFGHKSF